MALPYRSLQECINFLERVYRIRNGKKVSTKELINALNVNNPRNKRYQQIRSSSMEYGLLETDSEGYLKISQLGFNLLFPDKRNFKNTYLLRFKALLNSKIIKELVLKYQNKKIPWTEVIKQDLTKINFSDSKDTIDLVLESFIKSLEYLDLLNNSRELLLDESYINVLNKEDAIKLISNEDINDEILISEENKSNLNSKTNLAGDITFESIKKNLSKLKNYNYSLIILDRGREALLLIPEDLSDMDNKIIKNKISKDIPK